MPLEIKIPEIEVTEGKHSPQWQAILWQIQGASENSIRATEEAVKKALKDTAQGAFEMGIEYGKKFLK